MKHICQLHEFEKGIDIRKKFSCINKQGMQKILTTKSRKKKNLSDAELKNNLKNPPRESIGNIFPSKNKKLIAKQNPKEHQRFL